MSWKKLKSRYSIYFRAMDRIREIISETIDVKQRLLNDAATLTQIERAAQLITSMYRKGGKLYLCGNGGSAADAQHIAAELTGRFYKNRPALNAEAMHTNGSYLTAVANDYSFDEIYSRMVEGCMQKADILVGLSTSGNSPNVVKAFEAANQKGITTIGLTGNGGGKMKQLTDMLIDVPSRCTPRIQEAHILIGHIICEIVENEVFGDK